MDCCRHIYATSDWTGGVGPIISREAARDLQNRSYETLREKARSTEMNALLTPTLETPMKHPCSNTTADKNGDNVACNLQAGFHCDTTTTVSTYCRS